jgi:hypothetical protein
MSVNYSDIYRQNISLLFFSVYTDNDFLSVNTKRITIENEEIKKCVISTEKICLSLTHVDESVGNI